MMLLKDGKILKEKLGMYAAKKSNRMNSNFNLTGQ